MPSSTEAVVTAITTARDDVITAIRDEFEKMRTKIDVTDEDLHNVINKLQNQIEILIGQAKAHSIVELRLDDLFEVVVDLTEDAKQIKAVDLELNRWETDKRAQDYFAQNLAALQRGAKIFRIYVLAPHTTEDGIATTAATIKKHLNCNNNPLVKKKRGRIDVRVLYHDDIPDGQRPRDFAIFDSNKVLEEEFNGKWVSTFRGKLTKRTPEVQDALHYFETLSEVATPLASPGDVDKWAEEIRDRISRSGYTYDIFLGYCSEVTNTARTIKYFIQSLGYSVLDWNDFSSGSALLDEIKRAAQECRLGLFLFTKDDARPDGAEATPRDNVIMEYGYFLRDKGTERVAVVLETGAKRPTDLEGILYLPLANRADTSTIETKLRKWLTSQLGRPSKSS